MNLRVLVLVASGAAVLAIITVTYVSVLRPSAMASSPPPAAMTEEDQRAIREGEKLRLAGSNPAPPAGKVMDPFPMGDDSVATTKP